MIVEPSINRCVGGILLPWTLGPGTGATNLLNCIYTLLRSYHTFLPSIPHSAPLLCFTLLASDERQPLTCSLLLHLQPHLRTNLQCVVPTSPLHPDLRLLCIFLCIAPSLDSIFLCIALSCFLLIHLQPSYIKFFRSADENASSHSIVCGLVYPWSVACEPYCPQYWFTESVFYKQSR